MKLTASAYQGAILHVIAVHFAVAPNLHRLNLGRSAPADHHLCPDSIPNLNAPGACPRLPEFQLHLITLAGPNSEMVEFSIILGTHLLFHLDDIALYGLRALIGPRRRHHKRECQ